MYRARVERIVDHTKNFRELFLHLLEPTEFSFRAGQFLTLHVPTASKPALRAYSIASSDQDRTSLQLIFKYVPKGVASDFAWQLKANDEINFTGPFGKVFLKEPSSQQIVFLCTGSGVAQHICFLRSHFNLLAEKDIFFFMGLFDEAELYYEAELKEIQKKYPKFKFAYVLSQASDSWRGLRGYVQDHIESLNYLKIPTDFYLCGNGMMIKQTRELLAAAGFETSHITYEAFD